jgi:DNA polymerase elongation subunit (family B)
MPLSQYLYGVYQDLFAKEREMESLYMEASEGKPGYEKLLNRAEKLGVPLNLMSRLPAQFKKAWWDEREDCLMIAGTEVIDFLALYRKYTFSEEPSYKLDYIGGKVTGEHKEPLKDGYQTWRTDWTLFIKYNWQDVRLLKLIEMHERMFQLCVTAASEAHVPFSFVFESKKMLVGFVMNHLHQHNLVFPAFREQSKEEYPGAFVYSIPGFYTWLVSYDYRSLYPSIMMTFNTSPETKVVKPMDYVMTAEERATLIESPWTHGGKYRVYFRKDKEGIVPQVTRLLFDGRASLKNKMKAAKKAGDHEMTAVYDMMQKVYKVLGNSLYGLLGSNFFPFYDVDNAASITAFGRNLIKFTIEQLAHYLNEEVASDQRFIKAFGYVPEIDRSFLGTTMDSDGQVLFKRMSHGDTDSFYCKVGDLFEEFRKKQGTGTEVIVYKGHEEEERWTFGNSEEDELESRKCFNRMCNKYAHDQWHDPENRAIDKKTGLSKVKIMFHDGIVWGKGYRIIYNRYRLTDFCRIMDAVILEEKLDEFMLAYAMKWGYLTNELFLKREKCIYKAIVTAKKKYICEAESNEDIVYLDKEPVKDETGKVVQIGSMELTPDFAVTGLEIVRSSTTLFSRERMMDMVKLMLKTMDKGVVRERLLDIKREFFQAVAEGKYAYISMPSGMKEEPVPYQVQVHLPHEELAKLDWRRRAASVWNYLIEFDPVLSKEPYEPISAGEKMKFIKVADNQFDVSIICYTGEECPQRLIDMFHVDWDQQWKVSVAQILGRLFTAVGWPEDLEYDETDAMMELI